MLDKLLTQLRGHPVYFTRVFAGIMVLVIFGLSYSQIPSNYYWSRDDGVITLSHARNLVDYGVISVNPSGGRVEGYSSPAQFLIYTVLFKVFGLSYNAYFLIQTIVASFMLGYCLMLFFEDAPWRGLVLTLIAVSFLSRDVSFLMWHASGMENAITHVLFVLAAYAMVSVTCAEEFQLRHFLYVPVVFLATISRIEAVYYTFPVMGICLVISLIFRERPRKLRELLIFFGSILALWLLFNLWRYFYFGDLYPNTAYGQGKDVVTRLVKILNTSSAVFNQARDLALKSLLTHYGYLIPLAAPIFLFTDKSRKSLVLYTVILMWILLSCFYPFVFGSTRLDDTRATTHLAIFAMLLITTSLHRLSTRAQLIAVPAFLSFAFVLWQPNGTQPYYTCCSVNSFLDVRNQFLSLMESHSLPRPTVANPDLGVMSWYKDFNVVDLGWLGSPVLSRIKGNQLMVSDYLFELAAPDFIEIHSAWSCGYSYLFDDPRFRSLYAVVKEERNEWLEQNCKQAPNARTGFYIRKAIMRESGTAERLLIDALSNTLSLDRLRQELELCAARSENDPLACLYVTRTAYRFLPEFARMGVQDELVALFEKSPSRQYDQAVLTGNLRGDWWRDVITFLEDRQLGFSSTIVPLATQGKWKIVQSGRLLGYINDECSPQDISGAFFLHIVPLHSRDLPSTRQQYGFDNLDFDFGSTGFVREGRCIAMRVLPSYPILRIRTGQFDRVTLNRLWEVEIELETN